VGVPDTDDSDELDESEELELELLELELLELELLDELDEELEALPADDELDEELLLDCDVLELDELELLEELLLLDELDEQELDELLLEDELLVPSSAAPIDTNPNGFGRARPRIPAVLTASIVLYPASARFPVVSISRKSLSVSSSDRKQSAAVWLSRFPAPVDQLAFTFVVSLAALL